MKRKFLILWASILGICILAGIFTRLSYTNITVSRINEVNEFTCINAFFKAEDVDFNSVENLLDISDLVAKVIRTGESRHQAMTILSDVKIIDVIKGDVQLQGKTIHVYEPSYFLFKPSLYYVTMGYNLMQEGDVYILFLQKKEASNQSGIDELEQNSYVITTNSALGKFKVDNHNQNTILDENTSYTYGQVRHLEVLVSNKKELEFYLDVKNQVFNRINQ